ncbi:hypothetical protein GF345_05855 [Candidatus Woesearchaeota archaeon]|nr:hypothetical protein [Candidatus Woesearchaeota archaeon]
MSFRAPPSIVQKVLRFKSIQIKDGKFLLWNTPGNVFPLFSTVYLNRIMEKNLGIKEAMTFFYEQGRYQAKNVYKIITQNFGYAKTITDKKKLLQFNTGQGELAGWGKWEWKVIDFKNNLFILSGYSTYAEEYRKIFGIQKHQVDHFGRGSCAGFIEEVIGIKVFCVETSCMATGKKKCEFMIKPVEEWNDKDSNYKAQRTKDIVSGIKDISKSL